MLSKVLDHDKDARHQCTFSLYEIPPSFLAAQPKPTSTATTEEGSPPPPTPPADRWNFLLSIFTKVAFKVSPLTRALDAASDSVVRFADAQPDLKRVLFPLSLHHPVDLVQVLRQSKTAALDAVPLHTLQKPADCGEELPLHLPDTLHVADLMREVTKEAEQTELNNNDDGDDDDVDARLGHLLSLHSFLDDAESLVLNPDSPIVDMESLLATLDYGILPRGWSATMLAHGPLLGVCFTHVVLDHASREADWKKHLVLRPAPELDLNLNPWRTDFGLFEYILSGNNITSFTGPVSVDSPRDLVHLLDAVAKIRGSFEVCKVMCRFMKRQSRGWATKGAGDDDEEDDGGRDGARPGDERLGRPNGGGGGDASSSSSPSKHSKRIENQKQNARQHHPDSDYDVNLWVKQQMENNLPSGSVMLAQGPSGKRKRCGVCGPCRNKVSCGECQQCRNRATSRQICKFRKCIFLKGKGGRGSSGGEGLGGGENNGAAFESPGAPNADHSFADGDPEMSSPFAPSSAVAPLKRLSNEMIQGDDDDEDHRNDPYGARGDMDDYEDASPPTRVPPPQRFVLQPPQSTFQAQPPAQHLVKRMPVMPHQRRSLPNAGLPTSPKQGVSLLPPSKPGYTIVTKPANGNSRLSLPANGNFAPQSGMGRASLGGSRNVNLALDSRGNGRSLLSPANDDHDPYDDDDEIIQLDEDDRDDLRGGMFPMANGMNPVRMINSSNPRTLLMPQQQQQRVRVVQAPPSPPPPQLERPYSCGFCSEAYAELDDLVAHLNETHLKNGLRRTTSNGDVGEGISIKIKSTPTMNVRKVFANPPSASSSSFSGSLVASAGAPVERRKEFRCVLCGFVARSEYIFNHHRLSHAKSKPSIMQPPQPPPAPPIVSPVQQQVLYRCPMAHCVRQFGSETLLQRHLQMAHPVIDDEDDDIDAYDQDEGLSYGAPALVPRFAGSGETSAGLREVGDRYGMQLSVGKTKTGMFSGVHSSPTVRMATTTMMPRLTKGNLESDFMTLGGDAEGFGDDGDAADDMDDDGDLGERGGPSPLDENGCSPPPVTTTTGSNLYPCAECDARFVLIEDLEIHCSQKHSGSKMTSMNADEAAANGSQQQQQQQAPQLSRFDDDEDDLDDDEEGKS